MVTIYANGKSTAYKGRATADFNHVILQDLNWVNTIGQHDGDNYVQREEDLDKLSRS